VAAAAGSAAADRFTPRRPCAKVETGKPLLNSPTFHFICPAKRVGFAGISVLFRIATLGFFLQAGPRPMKPYWRITFWYVAFGFSWVFFSDKYFEALVRHVEALTPLQTIKGWWFVSVSGLLIFYLTKRAFLQHIAEEQERYAVFKKTVREAHHILLNYLNQMQLVTLEAEHCQNFDKETLRLAQKISEDANAELIKLSKIDTITAENIHSVLHPETKMEDGKKPQAEKAARDQ
jgi:hypothetical protein